ncbi:MAG: hypothetical protein FWF73_02380 [Spirochaetes bacterium]|nr:hypothetical protein [Spirochaetota bacterium]
MKLNEIGQIVKDEITILSTTYTNVAIDKYVIMPNHVHMIIAIADSGRCEFCKGSECGKFCKGSGHDKFYKDSGRQNAAPAISQIINQWKRAISIKLGFSPWQKSFHDHIIRNNDEYNRITEYIENNPARWTDNCYYKNGIT